MPSPIKKVSAFAGILAFAVAGLMVFLAACFVPAAIAGESGKTSLWKVSSPTTTIYLIGSIHLLKQEDYPLNEKMIEAYAEAEELLFEVHPDSLQSASLQGYVLQNAMYAEGKTLMSEFGESDYKEASALAEELEIDIGMFSTFKPWFVSIALTMAEMQKLGFDPELGVELHFADMAKKDEKPMSGLETAKYQIGLFVGLSEEMQKDMLFYTLRQLSDIETELAKIVSSWKAGDLVGLEESLNKSVKDFPEIFDKLVVDRNLNWAGQIDGMMEDGKTRVIVVGVGHMPGEKGLLKLLEGRGYKVEQQ